MVARDLSSNLRFAFLWLRVLASALFAVAPLAPMSEATTLHDTGQWSEYGSDWRGATGAYAIHMALTRGEGTPYHSYILYWNSSNADRFSGREMGWAPFTDHCEDFPDTNFTPITVSPSAGMNKFCAGHTTLSDGRLLIAGGNDSVNSIAGERGARVWQPGATQNPGSWTNANAMQEHRWYPTTVPLADGRILVVTGLQNQHHAIFGGSLDGTIPSQSVADSVRLYEPVPNGQWFQSVIPDSAMTGPMPHRPEWREFHSAVGMEPYLYNDFQNHQVYFGGKNRSGQALQDTWLLKREKNPLGADFKYKWEKGPESDPRPEARSEHTGVGAMRPDAAMYVFGGLRQNGGTLGDLWQLYWDAGPQNWAWQTPFDSGAAPSPRYGHAAFYDEIPGPSGSIIRRMILFGGADSVGYAPTDNDVYEMRIEGSNAVAWTKMTIIDLGDGRPSARFGHGMDVDRGYTYWKVVNGDSLHGHIAVMFGGQTGTTTYSNEFWFLWMFDDGRIGWEKPSFGGSPPSARAHASVLFDPLQGREAETDRVGRAYVFGGDSLGVARDSSQFEVDVWAHNAAWFKWAPSGAKATGHTSVLQQGLSTARVAEVYDPNTNGWTTHSSAHLYQQGYGPTILTPGHHSTSAGRVFAMGEDNKAYYMDVASGSGSTGWTAYSHGDLGFWSESMVMYRPGKILAATGIDSATSSTTSSFVSRTMTFDTELPDSAWKKAASGAGLLTPRRYHNMVIMPDGRVIAIGGLRAFAQGAYDFPTRHPQIWDPDNLAWSDSTKLAAADRTRDYHSTAILLPDGRILSAGGEIEPEGYYADLYSPPYLFNGDALATRPTLIAATGRWRYNQDVTFAVSGDTTVRTACLIRAPSTTHQFDQSQRYVPLGPLTSSVRGDGVRQFFLKAPPDSFVAPPGDYLLFVNNAAGVPSIAQWVRVGSTYAGQFDNAAPDTLIIGAEFVTCDKIYLDWIAPGDDGQTGTALDYDLRYSTSPVTTSSFSSNTRVSGLPIPHLVNTVELDSLVGLAYCTWHYFGGKTRDRAEHWSEIGRVRIKTSCAGLCYTDPGESMRRSRDESSSNNAASDVSSGLARVRAFVTPATLTSGSALRLVAEYVKGESAHWTLAYRDLSGDAPLREATASQLAVQEPSSGGWATRSILSVSPGPLGVRSLLHTGRVVFPAGTSLQSIEPAPQSFLCSEVAHSTLGDLLATSSALDSVSIEAARGDSLTLAFTSDTSSTAGEDFFFKVLVPGTVEQSRVHSLPRVPTGPDLPTQFALHSAHPNPFSRATSLRFDLPRASDVRIEVFDVQGRRVATLTNGRVEAGRHAAEWNGTTESGGHAAAGVYLCRMRAGDFTAQKRIALLP